MALGAFDSFCRGAERAFRPLADRDGLWRLLAVITTRKAAHLLRDEGRQKHGGAAAAVGDGDDVDLDQILSREPSPDFAARSRRSGSGSWACWATPTWRRWPCGGSRDIQWRRSPPRSAGPALHQAEAATDPRHLGEGGRPMSPSSLPGGGDPSIDLALRVDRACNDYEAAWREGRPCLEDYLADWPEPGNRRAARTGGARCRYRRSRSETPQAADYHALSPARPPPGWPKPCPGQPTRRRNPFPAAKAARRRPVGRRPHGNRARPAAAPARVGRRSAGTGRPPALPGAGVLGAGRHGGGLQGRTPAHGADGRPQGHPPRLHRQRGGGAALPAGGEGGGGPTTRTSWPPTTPTRPAACTSWSWSMSRGKVSRTTCGSEARCPCAEACDYARQAALGCSTPTSRAWCIATSSRTT